MSTILQSDDFDIGKLICPLHHTIKTDTLTGPIETINRFYDGWIFQIVGMNLPMISVEVKNVGVSNNISMIHPMGKYLKSRIILDSREFDFTEIQPEFLQTMEINNERGNNQTSQYFASPHQSCNPRV